MGKEGPSFPTNSTPFLPGPYFATPHRCLPACNVISLLLLRPERLGWPVSMCSESADLAPSLRLLVALRFRPPVPVLAARTRSQEDGPIGFVDRRAPGVGAVPAGG